MIIRNKDDFLYSQQSAKASATCSAAHVRDPKNESGNIFWNPVSLSEERLNCYCHPLCM